MNFSNLYYYEKPSILLLRLQNNSYGALTASYNNIFYLFYVWNIYPSFIMTVKLLGLGLAESVFYY